ncbi:MAG: hypothetical protein IKJ49_07610 [Bacteroidaceae bacterium]|nr:hypothetical protein [Bacteroidaceae bacterium]
MKRIKFIHSLFIAIFALSLVSCSSDDDDSTSLSKSDSKLVGIWRHDFRSGAGFYIFQNDGKGYEFEIEEYEIENGDREVDMEYIKYKYNEEDAELIIWEPGDDKEYYEVLKLTSNKLVIKYWDGEYEDDEEIYIKYDGSIGDIEDEYGVKITEE